MSDRKAWQPALSVGVGKMNAESLSALAAAGIHQVELSSGAMDPYYSVLDFPNKSKEIAKLAEDNGVKITSIHLPFAPFGQIDPSSSSAEARAYMIEKQCELIKAAGEAGIGIAVLHPSGEPYKDEERAERLQYALGVVAELVGYARAFGVTIALENIPRTCLCRTSDEMLYFLDRIPDLRVCFDTNHCLIEDNCHYIRAVGDKIITLHVSDYDFIDERHVIPGEGLNNWPAIVETLEEVGYTGRFLYELKDGYTCDEIYVNYKKIVLE